MTLSKWDKWKFSVAVGAILIPISITASGYVVNLKLNNVKSEIKEDVRRERKGDLTEIKSDLREIKQDIKEILKRDSAERDPSGNLIDAMLSFFSNNSWSEMWESQKNLTLTFGLQNS